MSVLHPFQFRGAITMMPDLLLPVTRRRHRIRAAVLAGALVAGLGTVVTAAGPAAAVAPKGYPLPIRSTGDVVVDGSHQRIFIADPQGNKVVAVGYNGSVLGTATKLPGVRGLALSADSSTLYAAAVDADAVVAIDTEAVTETARYSTGAGTEPAYLAVAGDKVWFGYGASGSGNLGSFDPAVGEASVTLDQDTGWYGAPILTATTQVLALAEREVSSGAVKILDVAGGDPTTVAAEQVDATFFQDLTFSPDGSRLLTVARGDRVQSWQTSDLAASTSYDFNSGGAGANAVAVAPDKRLAAGITQIGEEPRVYVFQPGRTTPVRQIALAGTSSQTLGQDDVANRGLVWEPNGSRLFAITSAYPDTYRLVVLTDPTLAEPKLTVSVPTKAGRAKPVTVSGRMTSSVPLTAGTGVTVTRIDDESPKGTSLGLKKIDSTGRFSFIDHPKSGGKITYRASFAGDATHAAVSVSDSVTASRDKTTLTLSNNKKVYTYGKKVSFTAKLGKGYSNRIVEIWADPTGADRKNRLVKRAKVNSKGELRQTVPLTRNAVITAVYSGDSRTLPNKAKVTVYTKVRISTSVSGHYKTKKIGSTKYYVIRKSKDPVFSTSMTAAPSRKQHFVLEYYLQGSWYDAGDQYFELSGNGKSAITLIGTHETNLRMRTRSEYVRHASGDNLNVTTMGPWRNFIFTN